MRTTTAWTDTVPEHEGAKQVVWDLCFTPDGSQLVAAVGRRIIVYDAGTGEVLRQRNAHSADVYSVSVSKDGQFIASGSADKNVSVWTFELSEKYKFAHAESVQVVRFNPVLPNLLASASAGDFAIWPMPSNSLRKIKLPSKALTASWTTDGQFLAIGMLSGGITVRDSSGVEKLVISRPGPVWDVCFTASKSEAEPADTLAVASWDGAVSFYNLTGKAVGVELVVGSEPCSARFCGSGDFLVCGGADRKATLYTREGAKIGAVTEAKDWVWRAVGRPKSTAIAVASNDGTVSIHNVTFSTVHGLYGERYAYRDSLTDVVVQHLITEGRARIKCKDYVKKLAVYRDRLAVQLSDRVVVYELVKGGGGGAEVEDDASAFDSSMMYRVSDRIDAALECNLLVVTSNHLVLCLERKLQLYSFSGVKEREWTLDAVIRYIKVVGGPAGREGLLVGLKNGAVCRIFVDNPFPVQLVKHRASIRCLDLSSSRRKLALVDETSTVVVYDVTSGTQLWAETGANSVAWNGMYEDMLCFSGNGALSIKAGDYPLHFQKLTGFVVGFSGSRIFCLHSVSMQTVDVPHSASLARYIEDKQWDAAYKTACLGVTPEDWVALGDAGLLALSARTSRAAFARVRDMRKLELVQYMDSGQRSGRLTEQSLLAEVLAYVGKFTESARRHLAGGSVDRAVEMLTDLRLWDQARQFAEESGRVDVSALLLKQAAWCEDAGDVKAAATIYAGLGQALKAVSMLADRGLDHDLLELIRSLQAGSGGGLGGGGEPVGDSARTLPTDVREALSAAGAYFRRKGAAGNAREAYHKLGDTRSMLQLLIDAGAWEEALELAQRTEVAAAKSARDAQSRAAETGEGGVQRAAAKLFRKLGDARVNDQTRVAELVSQVHVAHAEALALQDKFQEAQACFQAAGRPDLASSLTQHLAFNAVKEDRWADAAFHYRRLAVDVATALDRPPAVGGGGSKEEDLRQGMTATYHRVCHDADVCHAYALVFESVHAPFSAAAPSAVFHAACAVLNACMGLSGTGGATSSRSRPSAGDSRLPFGVSVMCALWALVKQGVALGAWRTARFAADRLTTLLLPSGWREQVDTTLLSLQTKPAKDDDSLSHVCARCAGALPLLLPSVGTVSLRPALAPTLPPLREGGGGGGQPMSPDGRDVAFRHGPSAGDCCPSCFHPVVRSALTFEPLPVLCCVVDTALPSDDLRALVGTGAAEAAGGAAQGGAKSGGKREVLQLSQGVEHLPLTSVGLKRLAALALESATAATMGGEPCPLVRLPLDVLRLLDPNEVYIVRPTGYVSEGKPARLDLAERAVGLRVQVNTRPDFRVWACGGCCKLFHAEDLEYAVLERGGCPVCRSLAPVVYSAV